MDIWESPIFFFWLRESALWIIVMRIEWAKVRVETFNPFLLFTFPTEKGYSGQKYFLLMFLSFLARWKNAWMREWWTKYKRKRKNLVLLTFGMFWKLLCIEFVFYILCTLLNFDFWKNKVNLQITLGYLRYICNIYMLLTDFFGSFVSISTSWNKYFFKYSFGVPHLATFIFVIFLYVIDSMAYIHPV